MSDLPGQPPYGMDPQLGGAVSPPPPPPPGYVGGAPVPPYGAQPYGYGYGPPQYGPGQPYGAAPYVYVARPDAPYAVASMVVGILGVVPIFMFPFSLLLSPVALILGVIGRSQVKQVPPGTYQTSKLTAGWILGIVGTVFLIFFIVVMVIFFAAIAGMSENSPR